MDALALPPTVTEPSSSSSSSATAAAAAGGDEETRRAAAVSRMRYAFAVWFPLQVGRTQWMHSVLVAMLAQVAVDSGRLNGCKSEWSEECPPCLASSALLA